MSLGCVKDKRLWNALRGSSPEDNEADTADASAICFWMRRLSRAFRRELGVSSPALSLKGRPQGTSEGWHGRPRACGLMQRDQVLSQKADAELEGSARPPGRCGPARAGGCLTLTCSDTPVSELSLRGLGAGRWPAWRTLVCVSPGRTRPVPACCLRLRCRPAGPGSPTGHCPCAPHPAQPSPQGLTSLSSPGDLCQL